MKHPGLHNLITSAITEFQAYQRTVHFNIFDSGFNNRKTRERGRRVCVGQCRNKKFESQLTSNILSPIPGNNGPFDCARLVLALSSRGCCTLLSLPLVQLFFSSSFSPFLFLLKPFRSIFTIHVFEIRCNWFVSFEGCRLEKLEEALKYFRFIQTACNDGETDQKLDETFFSSLSFSFNGVIILSKFMV